MFAPNFELPSYMNIVIVTSIYLWLLPVLKNRFGSYHVVRKEWEREGERKRERQSVCVRVRKRGGACVRD